MHGGSDRNSKKGISVSVINKTAVLFAVFFGRCTATFGPDGVKTHDFQKSQNYLPLKQ